MFLNLFKNLWVDSPILTILRIYSDICKASILGYR